MRPSIASKQLGEDYVEEARQYTYVSFKYVKILHIHIFNFFLLISF